MFYTNLSQFPFTASTIKQSLCRILASTHHISSSGLFKVIYRMFLYVWWRPKENEVAPMTTPACWVVQFPSLCRKLSLCCLNTGWISKHLVLPALDLCLASFSLLPQLLTCSDFGCGLFVSCCLLILLLLAIWYTVFFATILKRPYKLCWKQLAWLSAGASHDPRRPNNSIRQSLWTSLQVIKTRRMFILISAPIHVPQQVVSRGG